MATKGIEYVYLETHDFARSRRFWEELGFALDLDLGHAGRFVNSACPTAVFLEEVGPDRPLANQLYLRTVDETVPGPWHDSHWGTRLLEVEDPDGRVHILQCRKA